MIENLSSMQCIFNLRHRKKCVKFVLCVVNWKPIRCTWLLRFLQTKSVDASFILLHDKPHYFFFLQTKFVDASFILLQDKPNSNSYNCVERNLSWLSTCLEDTVFWDVSPRSLLGICPLRRNMISPSSTLNMETERTYETHLTFSPLYVITGDIWRKPILCANVHNMGYREKRGAKLCRKTKNLRAESTQKNMNGIAVT
jgi:hypothetical protein